MKIMNAFAQIFAIFAFLTLGSLFVIVGLHILSVDHAVLKVQEMYHSPWQSARTGFIGFIFIMLGLSFAKVLLKKGRQEDALILQTEKGSIVMASPAIEDVIKKVVKKYYLIKDAKIKILIQGKDVDIKLRLVLWSGGKVPDLLSEFQSEVHSRLLKFIGSEPKLELSCDVLRIEDHESDTPVSENS